MSKEGVQACVRPKLAANHRSVADTARCIAVIAAAAEVGDSRTIEQEQELLRMAILLALLESPTLSEMPDELEHRVAELLSLGKPEIRRRGLALRQQRKN